MTDRLPGSSFDNPILYRTKWKIYIDDCGGTRAFSYAFVHDDYDGADDANDSRCGHGHSVADCKGQIDDIEIDLLADQPEPTEWR